MSLYRKPQAYRKHQLYRSTSFTQTITATGLDSAAIGDAVIYDFYSYITEVFGPDTSSYGSPTVYNFDQFITPPPPGFDASAFGGATIDFALRHIRPTGFKTDTFGTAVCLGGTQFIHVTVGVASQAIGTAFVSLGTRQVYPHWWVDTFYGAYEVGYTREIDPGGLLSESIGAPVVLDNRNYITPSGFDALTVGEFTMVAFATRRLGARPIEPDDDGKATLPAVYLQTQYIRTEYSPDIWNEGGVCTGFMLVYNVNRVIDLVGNAIKPPNHQIVDTHAIDNNARIVAPDGQDFFITGPDSFIAFAIRDVAPDSWDGFTFGSFAIVYNAAAQILPVGFDASFVSFAAFVQNTRRYYPNITLGDQSAFGTAYADYAIRTITQAGSPVEDGGTIPDSHIVWFASRPIAPITPPFPWEQFGTLAVSRGSDHTLRPGGIPLAQVFGTAYLRNNTPQLYPYWNAEDAAPWGRPLVHHNPEYLAPSGWADTLFGLHFIDYRTKHVQVPGTLAFRPNNLHSVRNVNPDPPATQFIDFPSVGAETAFGGAALRANSIYGIGFDTVNIGSPIVYANSIFPKGIPAFYDPDIGGQVGIPTLPVTLSISVDYIQGGEQFSAPVMDPRTIWAPAGAPEQAHLGNPGRDELIDDFLSPGNSNRPFWGTAIVENENRAIFHFNLGPEDSYGQPALGTNPQYIVPSGQSMTHFGFPIVNGGGGLQHYNSDTEDRFGTATLTGILPNPWYFVVPSLGNTLRFDAQDVQNFNRSLPPAGFDATRFGTAFPQPPPPPAQPHGLNATLFGAGTFIDYRIRTRTPEGDDMLLMLYELGYFDERLKIHGESFLGGHWGSESATLGETLLFGDVEPLRDPRQIEPIGMGLDNIVPRPRIKPLNVVQVASVGGPLEVFGETWALAVTPGEIQPRGDDLALFGRALLERILDIPGIAGDLGDAAIAHSLGVSGFDASQLPAPVAMAFGNCGRQARALVGFDAAVFGFGAVTG